MLHPQESCNILHCKYETHCQHILLPVERIDFDGAHLEVVRVQATRVSLPESLLACTWIRSTMIYHESQTVIEKSVFSMSSCSCSTRSHAFP